MRFNRLKRMLIGGALAVTVLIQAVNATPVYADEAVEGEEAAGEDGADTEGAEGAEGEGGEQPDEGVAPAEASSGDTVTPGTIVANNGMYIANTFPDSFLPSGFRKQTVAYQGQNIELAYMDASNGLVSLAYLTDASGSYGDFYLCDTATAQMSDYVRFEGGNDRFIIVLNPGSADVPEGFEATALSVNGKSVTAWIFTGNPSDDSSKKDKDENNDDSEDKDDKEKDGGLFGGLFGALKPVKAYAGELDLGIGVGAGTDESVGTVGTVDAAPADNGGADVTVDTGADTDVSEGTDYTDTGADYQADTTAVDTSTPVSAGVKPSASDYFLVYGIDQSGNMGFYLYDSIGQTYQRYVDLGAGNVKELEEAQKSARIRLFIIAGLAVLLIVLLIILINMALSGKRNDDYYDDDDDYEEMKRRVEKKSKRAPRASRGGYDDDDDYDDDDYDDDDDDGEDVKVYNKKPERRMAPAGQQMQGQQMQAQGQQLAPRQKTPSQDIDLDDDFSFDFIKR